MVLNQRRATYRKVYYNALAALLADTEDDVPFDVVRAVCDSDAEARQMLFQITAARDRAKKGF